MSINPEEDKKTSAGEITAITDLALKLIELKGKAEEAAEALKGLNNEIHRIESSELPSLLEEFGVSEVRLKDGSRVTVKAVIRASLPSSSSMASERDPNKKNELLERFQRGVKFLEENGAGSIVRNILQADLGKDSEEISTKAIEVLEALGVRARAEQNVNPMSLSSWVKERIEAGKEIDHELFSVYSGTKAEIKPAKASSRK